jgi:hypothetical protein
MVASSCDFLMVFARWRAKSQLCCCQAFEQLHGPAARWALPEALVFDSGRCSRVWPTLWRRICLDELAAERKQHRAVARAENAEVPDADKSSGQYMKQETTKELLD